MATTEAVRGEAHGASAPDVDRAPRLVCLILIAAAASPMIAAILVLADGWEPTGDVATIGLRSRDAWTADAPLVGQPTTGDNYADSSSNHPGPIEYWLIGPFVRIIGPSAGLIVAMAVMNGAALAAAVWLAWRRGGPFLLALLAVGLACLVWSLGAASLVDPLNSEVAVYLMVLTVIAGWAVIERDPVALPAFVAAASVTAQVHVAGLAFVMVSVVAVGVSLVRQGGGASRRVLVGSLIVAVVLWLPVILQELVGPGNVTALWTTMTTPHPRIGLATALDRLVGAVAPIPLFARRTGPIGFAEAVAPTLLLVGTLLLGGWGSLVWRGQVEHRAARSRHLAVVIGLTLLVTTLIWSGNPPLAAFRADGARWLWVGSMLVWVSLGWSAVLRSPRSWRPVIRRWMLPIAAGVALAVACAALAQPDLAGRRDRESMAATRSLADQVSEHVDPGTYRVVLDGPLASFTVGPGVVYLLEADGYRTAFDRSALTKGFGDRSGSTGTVDGTLTIQAGSPTTAGREVARVTLGEGSRATPVTVVLS